MFWSQNFQPERDIPDLSGKIIIVTGANTGLGKETVLQLAKHQPEEILLAARTASKAETAIAEIKKEVPDAKITHLRLDLASFASVRNAVETFQKKHERLDLLINNAGVMATPWALTEDGYELQFGTNHMGHFLFTTLLMPTLRKTAVLPGTDVRIINLASEGHGMAPRRGIIFDQPALEQYYTFQRYGQSKLSNILFTRELAKRYPEIKSVAVHPGVIMTNLYLPFQNTNWLTGLAITIWDFATRMFLKDVKAGTLNQLWAATADNVKSGQYYKPVGSPSSGQRYAQDDGLAKKLWEWSEAEVAKHGAQ